LKCTQKGELTTVPYPYSIDMSLSKLYFFSKGYAKNTSKCFYNKFYGINSIVQGKVHNGKSWSYKMGSNFDCVQILPRGKLNIDMDLICHRKFREIKLSMRYSKSLEVLSSQDKDKRKEILYTNHYIILNKAK
jgi:hypothetical protein